VRAAVGWQLGEKLPLYERDEVQQERRRELRGEHGQAHRSCKADQMLVRAARGCAAHTHRR
jgi:hypothetical protein